MVGRIAISDEEADEAFRQLDEDQVDSVGFETFCSWCARRNSAQAAMVAAEFQQVRTLRRPARSTSFLVETEKALAVQEDLQDEEGVSGGPLDLSGISAHSEGGAADTSWGAGSQRSAASPVLAAALEAAERAAPATPTGAWSDM